MRPYLEIWNLEKRFAAPDGGDHVVVSEFNLALAEEEFVSIIGQSGCGKSTVLSVVAGLLPASQGVTILAGKEVTGPGVDRGVVFQAPCLLPWLSAEENVRLGLDEVMKSASRIERARVAREYLALVGLAGSEGHRPRELSLGMRQRVGLARAFALAPKMLLLDEPFGMLDSLTRFELQEALVECWTKHRMTALMVTHDVDEALFLSDRVVLMTTGPGARVGEILAIPFPRPRLREEVLAHPEYYALRERLLGFLADQAQPGPVPVDADLAVSEQVPALPGLGAAAGAWLEG